ncbi:MAG: hypothetical protein IKX45_03530 [Bacteroidales bacterium]|nr:hypothetical protein [Bacteroidales bacterium]
MDISLLSKMIGELLLDHEEVGLPGLGAFMAEMVPASFSDKGYTINPPYRRVTFLPSRSEDDSLVELYSRSNGIDYDQSKAIIQHFLEETKKELMDKKMVVFPGLGRLRSTRQNNFFFITDEDLDIFPDGFGLPAVSLKNHVESQQEVQSKVEELVALVDGSAPLAEVAPGLAPAEEPTPEEAPVEEAPLLELADEPAAEPEAGAESGALEAGASETHEPAPEPKPAPKPKRPRKPAPRWLKTTLITLLVLITIAAVALATFVILAQAAPDFIDSILYTPEELRIINY